MRDPLDELKNLSTRGLAPKLPPAEVRRRGDRMRRRRTALQAVGAAAAVAFVVSGGAFLTGDVTGSHPEPGPSTQRPTPSNGPDADAATIPEDFPIGAGLGPRPDPKTALVSRDDSTDQSWLVVPCSEGAEDTWFPGDEDRTAARGITVQGDFAGRLRQVFVYEDVAGAHRALSGFASSATSCAEAGPAPTEGRPVEWTVDTQPGLGTPEETSWVVAQGTDTTDGSHLYYAELMATRVGRAVVLTERSQDEPIAAEESLWDAHGAVVRAMCLWTTDGCASLGSDGGAGPVGDLLYVPPASASPSSWVTTIPDHVDLTEGLRPADSETKRAHTTGVDEPWFFDPCHSQGETRAEGRTDFLSESESGPGYAEFRQLAVYPSASKAEAVIDEWFVGSVLDCGVYEYDDGVSEDRWDALPNGWVPADRAHVYVNHAWTSDMRMTPATVFVVARIGNAVLVVGADGEFGADDASTRAAVEELRPYVSDVLTQQICGFGENGTC